MYVLNSNSMINIYIWKTILSEDSRQPMLLNIFNDIFFDIAIQVIYFTIILIVGWYFITIIIFCEITVLNYIS